MNITKTSGVCTTNQRICIRLQEIIIEYKRQCPVGKVVIDAEKIIFYKLGLKMGIARHSVNGIIYNNGFLNYVGIVLPIIENKDLCNQLCDLFELNRF